MAAATTTTPIRSCAAATASCRSTSTCRAARRPPRRCSTASCSSRRRSAAPAASRAERNRSPHTMTLVLKELGDHIAQALPGAVTDVALPGGELTVTVSRDRVVEAMTFLRDDARCGFALLMDVCGADYPERAQRFEVVYHLLSLDKNQRVRVKVMTDEATPVP